MCYNTGKFHTILIHANNMQKTLEKQSKGWENAVVIQISAM